MESEEVANDQVIIDNGNNIVDINVLRSEKQQSSQEEIEGYSTGIALVNTRQNSKKISIGAGGGAIDSIFATTGAAGKQSPASMM